MIKPPPVLDMCCGPRSFWFDKADRRALFVDRRAATATCGTRTWEIRPDIQCDFRAIPYPDGSFRLIVFDPPHSTNPREGFMICQAYGTLPADWRQMLREGFREAFRLLAPGGTLIFKWGAVHVPLKEILTLTPEKPLFGHRSGKASKTHWVAFIKEGGAHD